MKVGLDIQHGGKPGNLDDRGATAGNLCELDFTHRYSHVAFRNLHKAGCSVVIFSDDHYENRHERANRLGLDCYVALHMNAGGGYRGEVYFDSRTRPGGGQELSRSVATSLDKRVPWPVETKPCGPGDRAFECIKGVKAPAIVYEPAFLDGENPASLVYCVEFGRALAEGIISWGWSR